MDSQKKQMQEVAILYYEKKYTQQKIAQIMNLSRQTVSKLLNEAINEKIVEIKIYNPETTCKDSEEQLCKKFKIKYAWLPYFPDSKEDCNLFKKTSYYKILTELWDNIDIAIVGIGNSDIIQTFGKTFGYNENSISATGDISTHFFNYKGEFIEL